MSARATTGKLHIAGEARFSGLNLTGADAKLRIGKKERISISVNGQELDQTWGTIDVAVRPGEAKGSQTVAVNMGEFHVHVPDTGSQDLQDLAPADIVTGSSDGSLAGGGQGSGTAGTAIGAVGGAATQGLNKALSNISELDVSTRIDTSTGSARPEIVIQLSPRVSAQITRALGEPAPGTPPDLTFLRLGNLNAIGHLRVRPAAVDPAHNVMRRFSPRKSR